MLALVSLVFNHVLMDKFDKLRYQESEQLVSQTEKEMFKVGNGSLVKVQVEKLVAFAQRLHSRSRRDRPVEAVKEIFHDDEMVC